MIYATSKTVPFPHDDGYIGYEAPHLAVSYYSVIRAIIIIIIINNSAHLTGRRRRVYWAEMWNYTSLVIQDTQYTHTRKHTFLRTYTKVPSYACVLTTGR